MGGLFSSAGPPKLTRGEKYVEAKKAKIDRDIPAGTFATIDIQEQPIRDMGISKIAEYLEEEGCKCDRLILRKNNSTAVGATRIAKSLGINQTLTELQFIDNKMGDQLPKGGNNALESTLSEGVALVYGSAAASQMGINLKINKTLTSLRLEENLLGNEGCEQIFDALKQNTTLTDLTLMKNEIGNKGTVYLAGVLATQNTTLLRLDIQENALTDEGAQALFQALETNASLNVLILRANSLTASVGPQLASMLKVNGSLLELNLRRNALKDEGCRVLAEALVQNTSLKRLHLSSNLIGCVGCSRLAESMEKNYTLEEIHLEINNIEDTGCIRFAEALEKNKSLVKVDLMMNNFAGPGYQRLAKAVEKNASLRYLSLSNSLMASKEPVQSITNTLNARLVAEGKAEAPVDKEEETAAEPVAPAGSSSDQAPAGSSSDPPV